MTTPDLKLVKPPASDPRDTPAMRQYYRFRKDNPGCILLFRIGDFYEMFDDDAVTASKAIGLTLTQRSAGVPMAGLPFHQLDNYLRKFIAAGFRVAVCEQTQDAALAKGLVERAVTRVLTPGTLVDDSLLSDDQTSALGAICFPFADDSIAALAITELSTGALTLVQCPALQVGDELVRRGVTELIYPETADGVMPLRLRTALASVSVSTTPQAQWGFRLLEARESLTALFKVVTLEGFGFRDDDPLIAPAGALVRYLQATQAPDGSTGRLSLRHLRPPRREDSAGLLVIDAASLRSLEIDRTIRAAAGTRGESQPGGEGSLLGIFNSRGSGRVGCRTPMGKRLLRDWLCRPLCDVGAIRARQSCVSTMLEDRRLGKELSDALGEVQDVQRIGARVALGRATPRDVVALGRSLTRSEELSELLSNAPALRAYQIGLDGVADQLSPLADRIAQTCVDDAPGHLREGGLIRSGIDAALDEARELRTNASGWLAAYQADLAKKHQLPNLKVGYNKVFGYFIELPKAQAARAPAEFSRRQTLTNAERYITPELKQFEDKAASADAIALAREQAIFDDLCAMAVEVLAAIARFGDIAAELDVLLCFADKAAQRGWARPDVVDEPTLRITQGRHPVLDELLAGRFVPNDVELGSASTAFTTDSNSQASLDCGESGTASLALITGPNMAGKSTFIRQVALLTLLAHTGSFVPADRAIIGLTDRIFTRVGADDALFAGQSTFMVEMTETANILHNATERSLVILDEIGRGTSTLDGLSLAWAIAQTLANELNSKGSKNSKGPDAREFKQKLGVAPGPRTLFATHYHELTQLQELFPGRVTNLHVAVRELDDQIIFLHRILPGRTDRSYGLHVAKLAGIPDATVRRAREVLDSLTVEHSGLVTKAGAASTNAPATSTARGTIPQIASPRAGESRQLSLFKEYVSHPVIDELREVRIDSLSPIQAFDLLRSLTDKLRQAEPK